VPHRGTEGENDETEMVHVNIVDGFYIVSGTDENKSTKAVTRSKSNMPATPTLTTC
jgi:hypothetical protein